jgi:hypothetical protein
MPALKKFDSPNLINNYYSNVFSELVSIYTGVYKRMVPFQKFIKQLHSATGRCYRVDV